CIDLMSLPPAICPNQAIQQLEWVLNQVCRLILLTDQKKIHSPCRQHTPLFSWDRMEQSRASPAAESPETVRVSDNQMSGLWNLLEHRRLLLRYSLCFILHITGYQFQYFLSDLPF